jgi:hypothetical protein
MNLDIVAAEESRITVRVGELRERDQDDDAGDPSGGTGWRQAGDELACPPACPERSIVDVVKWERSPSQEGNRSEKPPQEQRDTQKDKRVGDGACARRNPSIVERRRRWQRRRSAPKAGG